MEVNNNKTIEQNLVLSKWKDNNYRGSWICITGGGKTKVGVIASAEFIRRDPNETSIVIVPTTNLKENEWPNQFKLWGYERESDKVIIECIQTAYKWTNRHFNTVVIDEGHHVLQGEQFSNFIKNNTFDRILILTATPPEDPKVLEFLHSVAPIIHTTNTERALKLGLISPFVVFNLPVEFTEEEDKEYKRINSIYSFYENQLGGRFMAFSQSSKYLKFKNIGKNGENICVYTPENRVIFRSAVNGVDITSEYCRDLTLEELVKFKDKLHAAKMYWKSLKERKNLLYNAENKIVMVKRIIDKFPDRKAIVFSESIAASNAISEALGDICLTFHSKMSDKDRSAALEQFKAEKQVISSVKALNEGMDVPDCSLGICHSGSSKVRVSTQRLGRQLRLVEGKIAMYINLYVRNTQEFKWVQQRSKEIKSRWVESLDEVKV